MKDNVKRVFYVRYVAHPCYLDIIAQRPEIRLDKLENETADEVARPIMAAAHAYQIGSARDELKPRFHVQRDLLARMPNLLLVSTNGAGFDTVNVKDCTDAGVLVVNQTGGNAEAVATHVLAMVLMLSKQIIQTNHALRRGTMLDRSVFMGNDVKGRTIGIVGIGNVGRRVAELCRGLFRMQVIACDPYLDEATVAARGAVKVTLDELLRRADFVSINCPLDDTSRRMIGEKQFALMQPHAYFITTARGFIHDERALEPAVRGLHQLAEIVLGDGDRRIFLGPVGADAALEAADDGVRVGVLEEHQRDAVGRHRVGRRHRDAMQRRVPTVVRPAHHQVADV